MVQQYYRPPTRGFYQLPNYQPPSWYPYANDYAYSPYGRATLPPQRREVANPPQEDRLRTLQKKVQSFQHGLEQMNKMVQLYRLIRTFGPLFLTTTKSSNTTGR
ncbi:hypothetical protein [Rubeoparvulum massiliense]|uniref:hypothetical protein n=1 Tax=Rubeoparvulum massiliense TaxID=1631346 RepID=UPI00065DD9A6|nr:hypothetical protein [Rubeoparvulum massiliense]